MAADQGIEPRLSASETAVMPLDESAILAADLRIELRFWASKTPVLPLDESAMFGPAYGIRTHGLSVDSRML